MNYSFPEILALLGSLGLFLYGMKVMSDALSKLVGDRLRRILARMTLNRVFAVFTGFLITAVIQSSSATTLLVVSFANAGLLTLFESIGVIMGANIGTTVTAWLITILGFKVSMAAIALPLVGLGFLFTFSKKIKRQHWGSFIIGFAILFMGLQFLKDAVPDIKQNPEILEWLKAFTDMGFWSVLIFLAIGTMLTVVVQSSSATMALTLVMSWEGWIPFDMACAMVLGENVGTTITANVAAIVANYNAKRTARAHLIFNLMGVIWMLILLGPFLDAIDWFVTTEEGSSPFESPEAVPVALSIFHTSFNIINTFILIWFVPLIARIVKKLIPPKLELEPDIDVPKYLDENALKYPQTAKQAIVLESRRLLEGPVFKIMAHALNLHRTDIKSDLKPMQVVDAANEVVDVDINELYYSRVKTIYSTIIEYSVKIAYVFNLSEENIRGLNKIKLANRQMVKAIKHAQSLQQNVDKYIHSDNEHMRDAYNHLRRKIAKVLSAIHTTGKADKPLLHLDTLTKLKARSTQSDVLIDGTVDNLIRKNLIDGEMATSLINDSHSVADICENLIEAAELLYVESDTILADM